MDRQRNLRFAALIVVLAIYTAARFWNLTASCLWFDEIFSVHAAEQSWRAILHFVALDLIHPPLFYIVLKVWIAIGGESLFWLRLLPVIFSVLAIVPFSKLCRELGFGFWTSTLAMFLVSVNGSLIKYAQEVRMYSMLMCVSLMSIWLFMRYFQKGKGMIALTLINLVLAYTHYFGWLVIISEVTAILALQRIKWRPVLGMLSITAVGFLPWIIAVLFAANSGSQLSQNIGWVQRPAVFSLAQLALNFVEPFYYPSTSIDPLSFYIISVPLLLISLAALAIHFSDMKRFGRTVSTSSYLLAIFIVLPIFCAFVASWILPDSIWGTRHLIVVFAPVSILIASSIMNVNDRKVMIGAVTLIMLFSSYALVLYGQRSQPAYIWCAWDELAQQWQSKPFIEPGSTKLYVFEDLVAYHFWFEFRNNPDYAISKVNGFPGITEDKAYFLPRGFDRISSIQIEDAFKEESFWIAFRDADPKAATPGLSMIPYTSPTIGYFLDRGFDTLDITKMTVGGETAYLVKLVHRPPAQ